jgi:mannose-1-phosphate guanylyltransferase
MSQKTRIGQLWGIVLAGGDGARLRPFLSQLCGGRGIKQFCTIIGRRSMLEHTLARIERLIPRDRILVIIAQGHQEEAARQLGHWPAENVIVQPQNRDTTAGILLPLVHISQRDPQAQIAIFPSDHFILQEERFIDFVQHAVWEAQGFPENFILLGMTPDRLEEGYGWIEFGTEESHRLTSPVTRFWEKPSLAQAHPLWRQGALWNSFVCVTQSETLWRMIQQATPDIYLDFLQIFRALETSQAERVIRQVYSRLRSINFSSGVCEPWARALRVLPVPEVGWSDWGSVERIMTTLDELGMKAEILARLSPQRRLLSQVAL